MINLYIAVAGISFAAGMVQGLSGFGSALLAMPLLLLFLPARIATPFCILMGLVITLQLGIGLKKHLDFKKISPLFTGCIPGIFCGTFVLKNADNDFMKKTLGIILIAYSLFQLFIHPKPIKLKSWWGIFAGFLTGVIGAAFSAGGPPTIIYASLNQWDKDAIKATLTGFFFLTGIIIAAAHAAMGITSAIVIKLFVLSVPFVIAGTYIGTQAYKRLSLRSYLKLIYTLLLFMGIMLLTSSITH